MKSKILCSFVLLASLGASPKGATNKLVGDYIEARTASVFAGACHYNGELVTTGRDAIMAWNIKSGSYDNIDLAGVKAMAAVSSQANLGDESAPRRSEIVIDNAATPVQAHAFTQMLGDLCKQQLGEITLVRRAPVTFNHDSRSYQAASQNFAALSIQPMPNNECCLQPNLVWYTPLFHVDQRKVGYTNAASYSAGSVGDAWQQSGENSAFYGSFSF